MSTPGPVIFGFVSTTAGEGASFMAVNFAQLLASDGSDTLLIDGDLRRSNLSKRIAPEAKAGLAQLLETDAALDDLLWTDQVTGLAFLPTGTETALANSATILASPKVEAVLSAARQKYRYIVIDLPPLDEAVDAKAAGEIIDRFLLVTAWGRTSHYRVETGLRSAEVIRTRLIGGILNRADVRVARRTGVHHDCGRGMRSSADASSLEPADSGSFPVLGRLRRKLQGGCTHVPYQGLANRIRRRFRARWGRFAERRIGRVSSRTR